MLSRHLLALTLGALLALGCGRRAQEEPPRAEPAKSQLVKLNPAALTRLGVSVAPAGEQGLAQRVTVFGNIDYDMGHYAEVGTLVEGRVVSVDVSVGDRVKRGQRLAQLVVPSIAEAQAHFVGGKAATEVARQQVARERILLEQKATTARQLEVARGELIRAEAGMVAAEARLKVLGAQVPRSSASIVNAGALPLLSPIDGVVVRRDAVRGAFLQPSETALIVADPSRLWATLQVFESDLPYFQVGCEVTLAIDALPGRAVTGKLITLEPNVGNSSRAVRARVELDNAEGKLRPGLFVRASVPLESGPGGTAMRLPAESVQPVGDTDVVFVEREPGSFEVRRVVLARRTAQVVEVSAGLERGERIAVTGAFLLRGEVSQQ